jgi:TrmH family RNA methyltransferase
MPTRLKRYKKEHDYAYAEGVFATLELLETRPGRVRRVLLSSKGERNAGVQEIKRRCADMGVPAETDDKTLERLSGRASHLAIGVCGKYETTLDAARNHVMLAGPRDMGNVGTIARTMLGFGFQDLAIVRPACDIWDPKVVRASMGAVFRLSFEYFDSAGDYLKAHDRAMHPLMTGASLALDEARFETPYTLVFGNEGAGLDPAVFANLGTPLRIPHTNAVDSLNLAVSVGITLYRAYQAGGAD